MEAIRQVKVHPLSNPSATLPFIDLSGRPIDVTSNKSSCGARGADCVFISTMLIFTHA